MYRTILFVIVVGLIAFALVKYPERDPTSVPHYPLSELPAHISASDTALPADTMGTGSDVALPDATIVTGSDIAIGGHLELQTRAFAQDVGWHNETAGCDPVAVLNGKVGLQEQQVADSVVAAMWDADMPLSAPTGEPIAVIERLDSVGEVIECYDAVLILGEGPPYFDDGMIAFREANNGIVVLSPHTWRRR